MFLRSLIILLIFIIQAKSRSDEDHCKGVANCGKCIQTKNCSWCMQSDYGDNPRCFNSSLLNNIRCQEEYVWNPDSEQRMLTQNQQAISPSKIHLKLRINQAHRVSVSFSNLNIDYENETLSTIELKDNVTEPVKATYYSSCNGNGNLIQNNQCANYGKNIDFTIEFLVTSCPENPSEWMQTFQIYPAGFNESLIVDLEMLCSCSCEHFGHTSYESNSPKCKGHGTYKCGICECDEFHFGRNCECSFVDVHKESDRDHGCRPDNTTLTDCSGKGQCICGVCECDKRSNPEEVISGKFCECDNFSCERDQGLLCGGAERGSCTCGHCICQPGWIGEDCTCRNTTDTCMPPNGGEICSGHGECVCGACKCQETTDGRYSGRFCEKCPTCSGRCHEFKDCVQCQIYQTGPMGKGADLCAKNCTLFVPKGVETLEVNEEAGDHKCTFYDENDCRFEFIYNDSDLEHIKVGAKEKLDCPSRLSIFGILE